MIGDLEYRRGSVLDKCLLDDYLMYRFLTVRGIIERLGLKKINRFRYNIKKVNTKVSKKIHS